MGKVAVSRETSVVSHTIAFQAHFGQKMTPPKKKKPQQGENVIIFLVYDGKKLVLDPWGKVEGGPRILFYFRIPEN